MGRNDPCWCGSGLEVQEVPRPPDAAIGLARDLAPGASSRRLVSWPSRPALTATPFRIWQQSASRTTGRPVDAIVVLGAAQYNGRPSAVFAARLDHAIELSRRGYAPYLVTTGGKLPGDRDTEAARRAPTPSATACPPIGDPRWRHRPQHARVARRTSRAIFDEHGLHTRPVRVAIGPTCCGSCGWRQDQGIEAGARRRPTSPDRQRPASWLDAMVHELGAPGALPLRRARTRRRVCRRDLDRRRTAGRDRVRRSARAYPTTITPAWP